MLVLLLTLSCAHCAHVHKKWIPLVHYWVDVHVHNLWPSLSPHPAAQLAHMRLPQPVAPSVLAQSKDVAEVDQLYVVIGQVEQQMVIDLIKDLIGDPSQVPEHVVQNLELDLCKHTQVSATHM